MSATGSLASVAAWYRRGGRCSLQLWQSMAPEAVYGWGCVDLALYRSLFVHRSDVFAEQQESGAYFPQRRPLTDDELQEHLAGLASYGVYTTDPSSQTVKYLVFDLDTQEDGALAWLCECVSAMVLRSAGGDTAALKSLILEFSGKKGHHLWLFLSEPLPARRVRAWVEAEFMPAWRSKADENRWPLDFFPRQDEVL